MFKGKAIRIVASVVTFGLLLMATISFVVPRTDLSEQMRTWAAEATGAEVVLGGVGVSWRGGFGLVWRDGSLHGSGAELVKRFGWGGDLGEYHLAFTEIRLRVSPFALLRGEYEVSSAHLAGALISAVVNGEAHALQGYELSVTHLTLPSTSAATGENVSFEVQVSAEQYEGQGTTWSEVFLGGHWADKQMQLPKVTAHLGSGQLAAALVLDYRLEKSGEISGTVHLDEVPTPALLAGHLPSLAQKLSCYLTGEVAGSMVFGDGGRQRESLELTLDLSGGEGVLDARHWMQKARPYLGDRQDLQVIAFDQLSHVGRVSGGRYEVMNLELMGPETDWHVAGWSEFIGRTELSLDVRLPVGFTPDLGSMAFLAEMLRDEKGRVNLAGTISGPTANLVIAPDIQRMLRAR